MNALAMRSGQLPCLTGLALLMTGTPALTAGVGELITDEYRVFNVATEFIVDVDGIIGYRDGVPEFLAAHLPDWLLPYVPSEKTVTLVCTP